MRLIVCYGTWDAAGHPCGRTTIAGVKAIVDWARLNPAQAGAPSPKPAA
jgi:hypothetical protein